MKRNANNTLLLFFCFLKLLAHLFIIHPGYDLHRDEYLHLDQANHLAWGYISVPPLSSWLALLIKPFGQNDALVHLLPAVVGMFTLVLVWKLVEALGGNRTACILSATAMLFSMLLRINMLFQPNSVDILAWTAVYYCLIKNTTTQRNKWVYAAAVSFAIGFLNKYNIIFLAFGLSAALLLTPERRLYANKHFWMATALALLLISPNLWWQYRTGFPVMVHMQELSSRQLVHVKMGQFLLEQVLFFLGSLYLIVAGFAAPLVHKSFVRYRFVSLSFIITLGTYITLHAKGYYALGLYPVLIALGATWVGGGIEQTQNRKWWTAALVALNIVLFAPPFRTVFPVMAPQQAAAESSRFKTFGVLTWEDGKEHHLPQDFADMLGWRELAQKTDALYEQVADKKSLLILCDNYGQAGAINHYSKHKNINALSFNADYLYWFSTSHHITNIIRVTEKGNAALQPQQVHLFQKVQSHDSITNPLARERGTTIHLLGGANNVVTPIIHIELLQQRRRWRVGSGTVVE